MFFSALLAASAVAQEKDRRTLVLLLLTHLSNSELVLGKLAASLLSVLVMLAAALPLFMIAALLGGVSFGQIGRVFAVTLAVRGGLRQPGLDLGLVVREDLSGPGHDGAGAGACGWPAGEIVAAGVLGNSLAGISCTDWAVGISPWRAILAATHPYVQAQPALGCVGDAGVSVLCWRLAIALAGRRLAVAMVRRWNCRRGDPAAAAVKKQARPAGASGTRCSAAEAAGAAAGHGRDSPVFVERKLGQSPR